MIVAEQSPFILGWAASKLNCNFGPAYTIANIKNGKLSCVVVFHAMRKSGCEVSIVSEDGLSKDFLRAVFGYAFDFCGYRRLTGLVATTNKEAITLNEKLGFVREGLLRKASDDGSDLYVYGMLKEECRWVRNQGAAMSTCLPRQNTSP